MAGCRVDTVSPGTILVCQGLLFVCLSGTTICQGTILVCQGRLFVKGLFQHSFTISHNATVSFFPAVDLPPTGGVGRLPFVERRRFRLQPQPHRHQQLWEQDPFLLHWVGGQPGFSGGKNSGGLFRYVWVLRHGGGGVVCSFLIISVGQKFGGPLYLGVLCLRCFIHTRPHLLF